MVRGLDSLGTARAPIPGPPIPRPWMLGGTGTLSTPTPQRLGLQSRCHTILLRRTQPNVGVRTMRSHHVLRATAEARCHHGSRQGSTDQSQSTPTHRPRLSSTYPQSGRHGTNPGAEQPSKTSSKTSLSKTSGASQCSTSAEQPELLMLQATGHSSGGARGTQP